MRRRSWSSFRALTTLVSAFGGFSPTSGFALSSPSSTSHAAKRFNARSRDRAVFPSLDPSISTVSMARVQELVRDERPGAVRLAKVMTDRPRYINLVVLLRIVCEMRARGLLAQFFYP